MNTIFVGGSRHVARLPSEVKQRLDNVVASGHQVIVGDANGADKAVQKHLLDARYDRVVVFCSGNTPRNNLGSWPIHPVDAPISAKGFQFYAAKDREMAREADFGLMIWDGKSPGTVLNVLRLVRAGKISVLFNVPQKSALNIRSTDHWEAFLAKSDAQLRRDVRERATPEEWVGPEPQPGLLDPLIQPPRRTPAEANTITSDAAITMLNKALASGNAATITDMLGAIARDRGMSRVARDTGLARESLYRSLDAGGNPEFATILKVFTSIGLCLEAKIGVERELRVPAKT